tara:strand:+ start:447 stop:2117 length:1671 start_codon:yes stop_codon:yes gene_type:complete
MNSIFIILFGLISFYWGYKYYSQYLSEKIFQLKKINKTPAHQLNDGIDFVPTKKHILFGHHFTSIAGAAPIIGPCIAVFWGWLPAVVWIILGTIFMGAVHDFGALAISLKEKGNSIASITGNVINQRTRIMFLCFVMCLTWLVLAVFAMAIAKLFTIYPSSVLPINIEILIAIIIGYLIYKKNFNSILPSLFALTILYISIYLGTIYKIDLKLLGFSNPYNAWLIFLFIYSSVASLLPVWLLLQPRDYINSHQLIVGLCLIYFSIIIFQPKVTAPMFNFSSNAPPLFPFLFVTIACGAISGFHGLVSSGTTSKQVNDPKDSRLIGYGAMIGEGSLALATVIASVAGIALVTNCEINGMFFEQLKWSDYYDSWENASKNKFMGFILGGGALIEQLGFSKEISRTLISVIIISFAATTLDTATRIQRMIITELGKTINFTPLSNKLIATLFCVIPAYFLTLNNHAWKLWPIFGASNQMLAALTLMLIAIYFYKPGKNIFPILLPMLIVMIITITSLIIKSIEFLLSKNYLLLYISILLTILILWMLIEGILFTKNKYK